MTRIVADESLRAKFSNFAGPVEVCDDAGRVIARLFPVLDPSEWEPVEPQISPEELQRRREGPDYSTAEVLAFLENLCCSRFAGSDRR
jgi:hypothetical protein